MKNLILSSAVVLIASSAAQAQEAVQWKVSDGGNGHWYQLAPTLGMSWQSVQDSAVTRGGTLACIASAQENAFVRGLAPNQTSTGYWLGAFRIRSEACSTSAAWRWVDGSPWQFTAWAETQPDCWLSGQSHIAEVRGDYLPGWHDFDDNGTVALGLVEWSADCNGDGIVDYGQCRDGSLADYNGNNIPDCCESGTSCVVGNYPVQWRVEDGGNGHWYQSEGSNGLTFEQARAAARGSGGWVVMPKTLSAVNFVFSRLVNDPALWWSPSGVPRHGPWIGLVQDPKSPEYSEPGGGWRWMDGSVASYFNWADDPCQPQPANCFCGTSTCGLNNAGFYTGGLGAPVTGAGWGAFAADMSGAVGGLIIEWSADCNNDGIVDYGQILQGQLVDADANGVPDVCEVDPCPGDITNGGTVDAADLSILLAAWGTNGQAEFDTDIDNSGLVDGGDLALVLGGWGPCPQ